MATETERQSVIATAHRRYATKAFDPDRRVSPEDLRAILEAGRLAPSSFGYEPWKFLVVRDEDLRAELAPLAVGAGAVLRGGAELVIVLFKRGVVHDSPHAAHIVNDVLGVDFDPDSELSQMFKGFQEQLLGLSSPEDVDHWAQRQTYIALANMLSAAAALDIDSVPIEGFAVTAVTDLLAARGIIDPAEWGVSVMAGFGYRAEEIHPKRRREYDEVVQVIG
ncbi:hypothetical protein CHIBA101_1794 [Actinomyces sp. Chiba101]|uniref:NAD(P)H-dependent oxidoreductase n=1 Tax=Actinomyces TaxID=1654 RepID=UPI000974DBEF|nr:MULTISPECIES: NAD(P)H-dependent oxidoreductase [Actinomyces]BAW93629.1 hypothetical protein CHIBA101_1794 [Actinomyces sp. Chiba101]GAV93523.1 hypothetical protein ADENT20671_0269 [Actinomyces denticolens]SUU74585.1 Putative NAD(P)H nitroreductase SAV2523 [Actinomyces denticolens]